MTGKEKDKNELQEAVAHMQTAMAELDHHSITTDVGYRIQLDRAWKRLKQAASAVTDPGEGGAA